MKRHLRNHSKCRWLATIALLTSCLIDSPRSDAALVVSVTQTEFQVGGIGSLFIEVTGSNDLVASMNIQLRVKPLGAVGSGLQLISPPVDAHFDQSAYLFRNNSFAQNIGLDPVAISTFDLPNDTFSISDGTFNGANANVFGTKLVGRVDFQHSFPALSDPNSLIGDQFEFEIDIASSSFADASFANVPFSVSPVNGIATLSAVPEPTTTMTLLLMSALGFVRRRRRKPLLPS
ncbi:PEP-CTERM sorting domain-containing protein [Stieleria varia]|uniref:Ice-binding protein C-terminal domain-containing protein n=1 Tax=Stieleria varia TaxID=2528005 RepID=A0A5C6BA41_9BACT|nr:PEP-CTERM sorting domain-containing protein [Stieleria varia]TWU08502.1 hypothetical protein Pla52n_10850 [Stieleria varia]